MVKISNLNSWKDIKYTFSQKVAIFYLKLKKSQKKFDFFSNINITLA